MSWGKPQGGPAELSSHDGARAGPAFDAIPSPHTLCRSLGSPPAAASFLEFAGAQGELPGIATRGAQITGFAPSPVEPADPLCLADEELTSYYFGLLRAPEELEQSSSSHDWQRVHTDCASDRASGLASPSTSSLAAQHHSSAETLEDSVVHANNNRILIDNARYASFGSPPASLIPRNANARPYAGSHARAAALLQSRGSAPAAAKRSGNCSEEACKRARPAPDLSQHSSFDSLTSESFALGGALGRGGQRTSSADLGTSPSCSARGQARPDAHSAASTPVLEIWQHASSRKAASQAGPAPTATLRPFSIVKTAEGLMTVAQLNSRIQGDLPFSPPPCSSQASSAGLPASPGDAGPAPLGEGQAADKALTPAIRLNGSTSMPGRGITIKQMMRTAWQRQ